MEEYRSNSHRAKEEARNQSQRTRPSSPRSVVSNTSQIKQKTSELKKTKESFISSDIKSVLNYAWYNIVIPGAKKLLADLIKNSTDMMLGQVGRRSDNGSKYTRYDKYSSRNDVPFDRDRDRLNFRSAGYTDLWFPTVQDAQNVKDAMEEQIVGYGVASILDLYEFSGRSDWITPMHNKYGWMSMKAARIVPDDEGYILEMSRPVPID